MSQQPQSSLSSSATKNNRETLTRDFIFEALYSPTYGYFGSKGSEVICSPPEEQRIPFKQLKGYWDYQLSLDKLYKNKSQAWLTPVEIFAPHYSNAIAKYIIEMMSRRKNTRGKRSGGRPPVIASERRRSDRTSSSSSSSIHPPSPFPTSSSSISPNQSTVIGEEAASLLSSSPPPQQHHHSSSGPLVIYEIGGGYGTNALCILDYLKTQAPELYHKTQYTIIEISRSLAEKQRERLTPRHKGICSIMTMDIMEWIKDKRQKQQAASSSNVDEECFVIAMEVMDNLPHDKITWVQEKGTQEGEWKLQEAVVRGSGSEDDPYHEAWRRLSDEWIQLLLQIKPELARRIDPREIEARTSLLHSIAQRLKLRPPPFRSSFLSTGLARLVDGLCQALPHHHFIFADFDSLPAPTLEGQTPSSDLAAYNAPLVTSRDAKTGEHIDHPSYVSNIGGADIFFPVDFGLLRDLYRYLVQRQHRRQSTSGHKARICKSNLFLHTYGDIEETCTRSGYNPLIEDFRNTCFFLAESSDSIDQWRTEERNTDRLDEAIEETRRRAGVRR